MGTDTKIWDALSKFVSRGSPPQPLGIMILHHPVGGLSQLLDVGSHTHKLMLGFFRLYDHGIYLTNIISGRIFALTDMVKHRIGILTREKEKFFVNLEKSVMFKTERRSRSAFPFYESNTLTISKKSLAW